MEKLLCEVSKDLEPGGLPDKKRKENSMFYTSISNRPGGSARYEKTP